MGFSLPVDRWLSRLSLPVGPLKGLSTAYDTLKLRIVTFASILYQKQIKVLIKNNIKQKTKTKNKQIKNARNGSIIVSEPNKCSYKLYIIHSNMNKC